MTMEVKDEFTVKTKRKEHPNARKYPGRASMEFGTVLTKFLSDLEPEEREQFRDGELCFEPEVTAGFFDGIIEGDVVGVGLLRGFDGSPAAYQFKILSIDRQADTMQARNVTWEDEKKRPGYKGGERELTFEELSCAFGMGMGEILERDGKPFGVSEEIEQVVKIVGPASGSSDNPLALPVQQTDEEEK